MEKAQTAADRIKALRQDRKGLTAGVVADAIGISRPHLSGIENGGDLPGRNTLAAIAAYYEVSVDFIIYGQDPSHSSKVGEFVDHPDELALLRFWRLRTDPEKTFILRMLMSASTDDNPPASTSRL